MCIRDRHGIVICRSCAVWATSGAVTDAEPDPSSWPCGHVIDAVDVLTGRNGVRTPATTATSPATVATMAAVRDEEAEDCSGEASAPTVGSSDSETPGDFGTGAS